MYRVHSNRIFLELHTPISVSYIVSGFIFPFKLSLQGVIRCGWSVDQLGWLQALVYSKPVGYQQGLSHYAMLKNHQLALTANLRVAELLPPVAALVATCAMTRLGSR